MGCPETFRTAYAYRGIIFFFGWFRNSGRLLHLEVFRKFCGVSQGVAERIMGADRGPGETSGYRRIVYETGPLRPMAVNY